jgi:UDP-N-acetylmuramyl pentapeptide phosphotransferase/UDP-N-acetylglucosamine-1-phosphate transferase
VTVGLAATLSAVLCGLVIRLGVKDAPTEARKTQKQPVPTSGGLGVALASLAAVLIATEVWPAELSPGGVWAVGAGAAAALLVGFVDDARPLPALPKLLLMLAITGGMVLAGARADVLAPWDGVRIDLPLALAAAGSIAWLLVVINAVNFMDGANGLSMGMGLIAAVALGGCGVLCGRGDIALAAFALAGGLAGFLAWNLGGRLFAGDAGALSVGAGLGGLSLALVHERPDWLFVPPLVLLPYLADVLLTLAWRWRRGRKLFEAHRDHVYQIALKAGLSHLQVSGIHAVWGVNAAVMGVASATVGGNVPILAFIALLVASGWAHIRIRKSGVRAGLVGADKP